jgi:D-alanine--poly(phosphoribitol) ligase subunit 2
MSEARQVAQEKITALIEERLGVEVPGTDADLIEAGLLDSLALVTLIVGLEDTFGCQLPMDDFDVDRFRSVDAMVDFMGTAGVLPDVVV